MKNKWAIIIVIVIAFMSVIIGCEKSKSTKEEVYKNFQNEISKMKSYKCKADVEVIGNKNSQKYSLIHEYTSPDKFKLKLIEPKHLKGKIMEYKGDKVVITNPDIKDKLILPNVGENNQHLFVGDFIKNYLKGEEIEVEMKGRYLVLTVPIPGNTKYFNKQKLFVDSKENYPAKLEILDQEGNKRFLVNYSNFEYKK